jgi:hypothetical protein
MSLRYGELAERPAFAGEEERRAAWFHHRDRLLQHCSHGRRPAGWWDFESPVPYPRDGDYRRSLAHVSPLFCTKTYSLSYKLARVDFDANRAINAMSVFGGFLYSRIAQARGGIGSTTSEEAPILKWARRRMFGRPGPSPP